MSIEFRPGLIALAGRIFVGRPFRAEPGLSRLRLFIRREIRILVGMAGWFEKLMTRAKGSHADAASVDAPSENATTATPAPGEATTAPPEGPVKAGVMFEILKLLSQIEYGIDVDQISASLSLTPEDAVANCEALEQEMFVHHHAELGEWFIAQRGLEFLRLNGHLN